MATSSSDNNQNRAAKAPNLQDGIAVIKKHAATLGNTPGVYQMLDKHDQTLYVGKAKALKKRVLSYTQPTRLSQRLIRMISQTVRMEFIQAHTEVEALLLEANLIKKKNPKYNILLKDDKSFPYILMEEAHSYPRLSKHRGAKSKKGSYFGPFASAGAVNRTLNIMQRVFMIRNCKDTDFENRSRPCLQYHIKRCTAPCVAYVSKENYARQVQDAKAYLSGESRQIQERMAQEMEDASANLEFEKAAALRDRIRALSTIQSEQSINIPDLPDTDVIAARMAGDKACVQVFFFRGGQNFGNRTYYPQISPDDDVHLLLSNFIAQFYRNKPVPKEILINTEAHEQSLLQEALSQSAGYKTDIKAALRGKRKKLVDWVVQNLDTQFELYLKSSRNDLQALEEIAKLFDMEAPPERIEIYDNSHISGSDMVGAMVVAGQDGLQKNQYRKFNMQSANLQDDFDMMREVMRRRFERALKEQRGPGTDTWPDLLLIDGGKGQLSAVTEVLESLGILDDVTLVAISKGPDRNAGREEFHMNGKASFKLPERDATLHYLQRLRDEAHRFAIGAHRTRRQKSDTRSALDSIPGIGGKRKKALLLHFGSAKSVERAGIADLVKVEGISESTARIIYDYFHDK